MKTVSTSSGVVWDALGSSRSLFVKKVCRRYDAAVGKHHSLLWFCNLKSELPF